MQRLQGSPSERQAKPAPAPGRIRNSGNRGTEETHQQWSHEKTHPGVAVETVVVGRRTAPTFNPEAATFIVECVFVPLIVMEPMRFKEN